MLTFGMCIVNIVNTYIDFIGKYYAQTFISEFSKKLSSVDIIIW